MAHDNTVQSYVRRIALERGLSHAEARRLLVEQIDHLKRTRMAEARTLSERGVGKLKIENPHRRLHEPGEPLPEKVDRRKTVKPAEPERVKTPDTPTGTPDPEKPSRSETDPKMKSPPPGTEMAIVVGALRDNRTFADAENALMGMARYSADQRHSIRAKMYRACQKYDIPIR